LTTNWSRALLAGGQLQEIGLAAVNNDELRRAIADRVAGWLVAALPVHPSEGGLPAAQRAQAGDLLALLGDPRFDPARLFLPADDSLGFVRVAADPAFRIGTRKVDAQRVAKYLKVEVDSAEINDELTPTRDFYIGRFPVTVLQFRSFVETAKFPPNHSYFEGDTGSQPEAFVDWREARAYAAWLNDMFALSPIFAGHPLTRLVREGHWRIDLPSELEWEKAARGDLPHPVFSWGDLPDAERANYADTALGRPTTVGCFGVNGHGLSDMLGNMMEWTRSAFGPYPYPAHGEGREPQDPTHDQQMVVRGGSCFGSASNARCACRGRFEPNIHMYGIGFRVVLRSTADL
jgi:formylglycine-generating enzyme required for sulfatase activity